MTTTAGEKPCSVIDTLTTALAAAAASLFTATPAKAATIKTIQMARSRRRKQTGEAPPGDLAA